MKDSFSAVADSVAEKLRACPGSFHHYCNEISQTILRSEKDLADYDTEISQLEYQLSVLKTRREQLKRHLSSYHSLLSPVRHLPTELLSYIFDICCERNRFVLWDDPKRYGPPTSFLLSAVCSSWRQVALATPTIWANLDLSFPNASDHRMNPKIDDPEMQEMQPLAPAIELCVERSRQAPLNLWLRGGSLDDLLDKYGIMANLLRHSSRWEFVHFDLVPYEASMLTEFWTDIDLSGIRFLRVNDMDLLEIVPSLRHAPLKDLVLEQVTKLSRRSPLLDSVLPWTRITQLHLTNIYMCELWWLEAIEMCTELQSLSFEYIQGYEEELGEIELNGGPCTLEKLERLTIHLVNDVQIDGLFDVKVVLNYFTLPSLKYLEFAAPIYSTEWGIGYKPIEGYWPIEAFRDFIARSRCPLSSLHINRVAVKDSDLLSILYLVPTLVELEVKETPSFSTITDHLLQILSVPFPLASETDKIHVDIGLAPKLQRILFHVNQFSFNPENLLMMVQRRQQWTNRCIPQLFVNGEDVESSYI